MSRDICGSLKKREAELRKHSIYLVSNFKKTFDYEYLVFVDPDDEEDRTPFLRELFNIISNGHNNKRFVDSKHLKELKKWIGAKDDNDKDLNPYNWIKIAIERYPYRLFVATNEIPKKLPEFIKKRICFLNKKDINNKSGDKLKLFLSIKWLEHVLVNVNNKKKPRKSWSIEYYIAEGDDPSRPYFPETVPDILKSDSIGKASEAIKDVAINEGMAVVGKDKPWEPEKCTNYIYLNRHKAFYKIKKEKKAIYKLSTDLEAFSNNLIYSEALSGNLSYLNQISFSLININENLNAKLFFVKYADSCLMRLGICDERFQEWWLKKDISTSINLAQQLLWPAYLNEQNYYGQKEYPKEGMWYVLNCKDKIEVEQITTKNINLKNIWLWKDKGLDLLIIHQGILDKLIGKHLASSTRFILMIKEKIPFIVITSGRGRPDKLPYGVKFLPYSNIDYCIKGNYFEKFSLIRAANSIAENI